MSTIVRPAALNLHFANNPPSMRVRGRSGSIVKVEHIGDRLEDVLDQNTYLNHNANWVNAKGAWLIHIVFICVGKIIIDALPGMTQEISWTLVNILYLAEFHSSQTCMEEKYDDLTL
ncbi:hypothetical protein MPER_10673, partial [Moniliophthora perniciosa FA553]